jgi:hypothetical protein
VGARVWLLLAWIVVGTAVLIVHALVVWRGVRAKQLSWTWRLLALVPPAAPVVAWRAGHRALPIVWGVLVIGYVVLRLFG